MKKQIFQFLAIYFFAAILLSCSDGDKKSEAEKISAEAENVANSQDHEENHIRSQKIKNLTHSIPCPVEITHIIKSSGGDYIKDDMNPASHARQYNSSYKQSLNLGVYSADLTLASMYHQHQDALTYLASVNHLATAMEIDHLFDMDVIGNLLKNNNNLDSLLVLSTSNFEKINLYLHSQNRSHQTTLILTGGWIEGLYLLSQIQKQISSDELSEKIGEQKIVLEQLLKLLSEYKTTEKYGVLYEDLKALHEMYQDVHINTTPGETKQIASGGMMLISSNAIQNIDISKETLHHITDQLDRIRKNIIAL